MTTIGVLGTGWRASVTPWGDVLPWSDEAPLRWYVAADDRWHQPAQESAVRQTAIDGTPVIETRLRIPSGDAVQRVYATADGVTVVEVENDSPMAIAVAFSRGDVLTGRPPTDVPIQGIDLPDGAIVLPVGHRTAVRVGLAHDRRGAGSLPDGLPGAVQVARGWTTVADRAGRVVVPEPGHGAVLTAARCAVALEGPVDPDEDGVAFLLGAGELVRIGEDAEPWVLDVVDVAERLLRACARVGRVTWDEAAALWAAARLLTAAGEDRGGADVEAALTRLDAAGDLPTGRPGAVPDGIRAVAWIEGRLAQPLPASACCLLPTGVPAAWLGGAVEGYHLPAGLHHTVSFAIRWHGERPAVLWEVSGPAGLGLSTGLDAHWSSIEPSGEALWPAPPAPTGPVVDDSGGSFS